MSDSEAAAKGAGCAASQGELLTNSAATDVTKSLGAGAVVLRVKRRVTEEPLPTLALHAKKLRLQTATSGAAVFRLAVAGTLAQHEDQATLQQAVARAFEEGGKAERPRRSVGEAGSGRRRKRYRILRRVELAESEEGGGGERRQKRKRQMARERSADATGEDAKRSKGVHVFDVEFESAADLSQSARNSAEEDYNRQLAAITMNEQQLLCTDARSKAPTSDSEPDFVYDLYLANAAPGDFVMTSDLGAEVAGEEEEDLDESGWAFLLDGYEENYSFPNEYRQKARRMEDDDSDPDSESNWRNDYPDAGGFGDHGCLSDDDFDFLGDREAAIRDSDEELCGYAYDDDLERGLREMELSKVDPCSLRKMELPEGAAPRVQDSDDSDEEEWDFEKARERRCQEAARRGPKTLRQLYKDMVSESADLA